MTGGYYMWQVECRNLLQKFSSDSINFFHLMYSTWMMHYALRRRMKEIHEIGKRISNIRILKARLKE